MSREPAVEETRRRQYVSSIIERMKGVIETFIDTPPLSKEGEDYRAWMERNPPALPGLTARITQLSEDLNGFEFIVYNTENADEQERILALRRAVLNYMRFVSEILNSSEVPAWDKTSKYDWLVEEEGKLRTVLSCYKNFLSEYTELYQKSALENAGEDIKVFVLNMGKTIELVNDVGDGAKARALQEQEKQKRQRQERMKILEEERDRQVALNAASEEEERARIRADDEQRGREAALRLAAEEPGARGRRVEPPLDDGITALVGSGPLDFNTVAALMGAGCLHPETIAALVSSGLLRFSVFEALVDSSHLNLETVVNLVVSEHLSQETLAALVGDGRLNFPMVVALLKLGYLNQDTRAGLAPARQDRLASRSYQDALRSYRPRTLTAVASADIDEFVKTTIGVINRLKTCQQCDELLENICRFVNAGDGPLLESLNPDAYVRAGLSFDELEEALNLEFPDRPQSPHRTRDVTREEWEAVLAVMKATVQEKRDEVINKKAELLPGEVEKARNLIQALRMDQTDGNHLEFWESNTTVYFGSGGEPKQYDGRTYQVPRRVSTLMDYVDQEKENISNGTLSYDDFLTEVNRLRQAEENPFWGHCLSLFGARKGVTQELYDSSKTLETIIAETPSFRPGG